MDASQWHVFHRQLTQLSQRQRLISIGLLHDYPSRNTGITVIEQAAQAHLQCPACSSTHFHRHGHANQLQRYRCVPCGKTFNALSGTPLVHLRHKERWLAYAGCMLHAELIFRAQGCRASPSASQHQFSLAPSFFGAGQDRRATLPAWHYRS